MLWDAEDELLFDDLPGASWAEQEEVLQHSCTRPLRNIFDVLATKHTWQGKQTLCIQLGQTSMNMMKLSKWPVQLILNFCDVPTLYRLSVTCKDFTHAAFARIEAHADEDIMRLFFDNRQHNKFLNLFGCYTWAVELQDMLTLNTLQNWSEEEIHAAYNINYKVTTSAIKSGKCIDTQASKCTILNCLSPQATTHWLRLGRCAFQDYFCSCIATKGNKRRLLSLYKRAWAAVVSIFELNANDMQRQDSRILRGVELEYRVTASWPNVEVVVMSQGVCETHSFSFCR